MKRLKHTYLYILLAAVTMVMAACSSDDDANQGGDTEAGQASVTLRIATGNENAATRAWVDSNAKTDRSEMMYNWIVLITNGSTIKYKYTGTPAEAKAEIDDVCTEVMMAAGNYTVYSFANISEESLKTLLGISSLEANTALTEATVTAATATINGNGFDTSATDNGFGSQGIPMSGKQTLTVPATGSLTKDLIVVRMLAKMELRITNSTGATVTVKKITLTGVTSNADNNLMLLPSLTYNDDMVAHHQDVRPNLNGTPTTTDFVVLSTDKTITNEASETISFYVNESATPTTSDGLFELLLELDGGEYRYSLISDNASHEWNYIARNDYRIIPITLDDYHFDIVPYDFPPIGVYPVSVKALDTSANLYEFTFHDYGHFHLLPRVTKGSGGSATIVPYASTAPVSTDAWTLSTDWAGTWFTAATKGEAWLTAEQITANGFYRTPSVYFGSYNDTNPIDGDELGGIPVWYTNDFDASDVRPKWDPLLGIGTATYQPFVFGYIADPGGTLADDKQIYHEMKIRLYVSGTYRRDMLYRFYMTLSKDQMLGARSHAAARRPHSR